MYVSVPNVCLTTVKVRENIDFPGTGVTDNFKLLCVSWDTNPGHLKEPPVILTADLQAGVKEEKVCGNCLSSTRSYFLILPKKVHHLGNMY